MKQIAKIQARCAFALQSVKNDTAALTTVEVVLLMIGVLAVIASVFFLYTTKVNTTTETIGDKMQNAPENMFNEFGEALENAMENGGGGGSEGTTR